MVKGAKVAQSYDEMVEAMSKKKAHELAITRGNSNYKLVSGEYQEGKLKQLISSSVENFAEFATRQKVSLDDIQEIKKRTLAYLTACEETGTFPTNIGLARCLGYSDRNLRHWRQTKPNTETAEWLEMFNETCVDIMNQSALKNNANSVMAIFINKAHYNYREKDELIITPNTPGIDDETAITAEEIRKRYGMEEGGNYDGEN